MNDNKNTIKGELLAHGADNYLHDPDKSINYYVQIKQDDGTIAERWSKNLEEVIKNSGVQTGDKVILTELGKEPIQVGDKTFNKTLWDLQKYESALELPNIIEHDTERELKKLAPAVSADKTKENEQDMPIQLKKTPNLSDFEFELPSNIKNNYIAITKNRFLQDEKVNYYDKNDKDQVNIAFEDRSKSLHTSRQDEKTIHAMLDLAQSKGWSAIKIKGTEEFKQKAWLEASLRGIEVKGYEPNEKDLAQLQAKQAERTTNQVEMTAQKPMQVMKDYQNTSQLDDLDKSTLEMIKSLNAQEVQNLSEQDFNKRLKSIENPLQDSNFLVFQALRTGNENWIREAKQIADLNKQSYLAIDVVERRYDLSEEMRKYLEQKEQVEPSIHTPSSQQTIYNKLQEPKDNQAYLEKIGLDFSGVQVQRFAKDEKEAREQAVDFTGKELTNLQSGIQAIISKKNLEKMLSGKAEHKSVSKEIHAIAVANADKLFESSVFAWQSNYKNDSPDIEAVHRAIAPMKFNDEVYLAKLTIKEMTREQGNRVYSVEAVDIEQSKSPVPEMTEVDTAKYSVTPHRLNEALIDIIVKNAQEYNRQNQKNVENFNEQKSAQDIKNDIRQIFQTGYKDGSIKSRDELVEVLKERGFEVKENDKSIRVSLPNSDQAVNLKGEVFTKGYDTIKSLKESLEPETLKQTYPTLKDSDIVHITAYKNKLFDDHKENPNIKILQASLVQLETGVKDLAKGKELNLPNLPVNEIKPDVQVRTTDNHDKSRQM